MIGIGVLVNSDLDGVFALLEAGGGTLVVAVGAREAGAGLARVVDGGILGVGTFRGVAAFAAGVDLAIMGKFVVEPAGASWTVFVGATLEADAVAAG